MKLVEYLNGVDDIKIVDVFYKMIPYGYSKTEKENGKPKVLKVRKKVVEVEVIGDDISFLNYLSDKLVIQISDTFYRKNGASFVYEYLYQSNDYTDNLYENKMNIFIMYKGGLLGD